MAHLYPKPSKTGFVRLVDGLFLGNLHASGDLNFLILNKISHLVNCAGREVTNVDFTDVQFEQHLKDQGKSSNVFKPVLGGLKFLTFYWLDDDRQLIFDEEDRVPKEIVRFIDEALDKGTGVLIHSVRG